MALPSGTKLGPYEIQSPLGAGGMGEVYRAHDGRLGRDVAVKVLPEHLSSDPNLKARFEREARAISALSHPHICHLYDVGSQGATDYLVMELLQGESLADRLLKGALPLNKAVQVGIEISEALETAHKNGIVHRDLKPGNVMLTKSGAKLLDFGLAKPTFNRAAMASGAAATMTSALTGEGKIIGTFQYMAPEQVQGHEADARTDLFALGAVLYEMVTGQRAFAGKSEISVMSAILEKEPEPISAVQPLTPPALDHVIRRALAKDPDERWQSVADLKAELKWIAAGGSEMPRPVSPLAKQWKRLLPWVATTGLVVVVLSWALSRLFPTSRLANRPVTRLVVTVGPEGLGSDALPHLALAPDGSHLVYVANHQGNPMLYSRSLDSFDSAPGLRRFLGACRPMEPQDLTTPEENAAQAGGKIDVADLTKRAQDLLKGLKLDIGALKTAAAGLPGATDPVRKALIQCSWYGVTGAIPATTAGPDATLGDQAQSVIDTLQARYNKANAVDLTKAQLVDFEGIFKTVFAADFAVLPHVTAPDVATLQAAFGQSAALTASDTVAPARWLRQLSHVRPAVSRMDLAFSVAQAFGTGAVYPPALTLAQLPPVAAPDRWLALPLDPAHPPQKGRVAFACVTTGDPTNQATYAGVVVDEWPERIPNAQAQTSVAFHFEEPSARAPQALLLATCPDNREIWDDALLQAVLKETLELAKIRTVDLGSVFQVGQILPALYFALNLEGATVSTRFAVIEEVASAIR